MPPREIGDQMRQCFEKMGPMGPQPDQGSPVMMPEGQTGPGGCKTPEECKNLPIPQQGQPCEGENCQQYGPPPCEGEGCQPPPQTQPGEFMPSPDQQQPTQQLPPPEQQSPPPSENPPSPIESVAPGSLFQIIIRFFNRIIGL